MTEQGLLNLIEQLQHKSSPNRRAAAKKLRKLKANEAGPALLAALKKEVQDTRTWETQYQMIMALGEAQYIESLGFLHQLASQDFEATMIYLALGDSVIRLHHKKTGNIAKVIDLLSASSKQPDLFIDGALRAVAMMKVVPNKDSIDQLISYASKESTNQNHKTWIASAAAGWDSSEVIHFLNECINSSNQQTVKASKAALNQKYISWSIL